jgi:homoserine dehydrogenase
MKKLNIGLFGYGCVGTGLYRTLNESKLLNAHLQKICVKNPDKPRDIAAENFTYNKYDLLDDPQINVIVELIDDAEEAYNIVKEAIIRGKSVVTANKKMVSHHLTELLELSRAYGVSFLYEGAVCGSIPIIRNLEEYYNNDSLSSISGICNGTTNYILTGLFKTGKPFGEVLQEAQQKGFAESDPTMDIDGYDAKFKLQILIAHAFGLVIAPDIIFNYGIRNIDEHDVQFAREKGLRIKLFSYAARVDNTVVGFVAPHFINEEHFAWNVHNEFNAVVTEALFSDRQLFIGKGAGSFPTGSAVLSDVSALQYGYAYEYRKLRTSAGLNFSNNFLLEIYASAKDEELLNRIPFTDVNEKYTSKGRYYITGVVPFNKLTGTDWNALPGLFIAVVGKPLFLNPYDKTKPHEGAILQTLQPEPEVVGIEN